MSDMASIRAVIASTERTKKITSAMQLVASSKMAKSQRSMSSARPYADTISKLMQKVAESYEGLHPFFEKKSGKKAVYIVISSDRGLCGGLNVALFKKLIKVVKETKQENICAIGNKAKQFFRRIGGNVLAEVTHLGDQPSKKSIGQVIKPALDGFLAGEFDEVHVVYNKYVNVMTQEPNIAKLLPIEKINQDHTNWGYIYEPDAESIIDKLVYKYIDSVVYKAVLENLACEQAARMIAMKSATENAQTVIDELNLAYNKARQAVITTELSEIIAGADAV
ncbi:MAG: ATP synthase F1 subunit gamma [Gammaproteobacteria bacterium]|nr:ATP synthase F1 subunit gamma [Gammaproteobacteria bacterium]